MGFSGISSDLMGFHGISWDFMGFNVSTSMGSSGDYPEDCNNY